VVGFFAFRDLTIEAFPDPTDTQVQVITTDGGQPAEEIERKVSIPIERALNGVPGTIRQRSVSLFGLSDDVTFEPQWSLGILVERPLDRPRGRLLGGLVIRFRAHGDRR
jgi:Cu/Ag efflux pump CusA